MLISTTGDKTVLLSESIWEQFKKVGGSDTFLNNYNFTIKLQGEMLWRKE